MAVTATTIFEVRSTGSDSACSGGFDPSKTAGMFTDGAATSATGNSPVFSSASYNFVAGDVGAWVYIASGTNWTPGWYEIASVATNVATLKAAVGEAVGKGPDFTPNATAGCATTASPTGATWTIDYSQQAAAAFTFTDLTYVSGTTFTSATVSFAKQHVGNVIRIDSGTNFTAGYYVITSVAAGVATLNATACSGASSNGAGCIGGCFANPGQATAKSMIAGNKLFIKGSTTYTATSGSYTAGGACILNVPGAGDGVFPTYVCGYQTVRGDTPTVAQLPKIYCASATVGSGNAVLKCTSGKMILRHIWGASDASAPSVYIFTGNTANGMNCMAIHCKADSCNYDGISAFGLIDDCYLVDTGNGGGAYSVGACFHVRGCFIKQRSGGQAFNLVTNGTVENTIVSGGTNAFQMTSYGLTIRNNIFYNQSSHVVTGGTDGYGNFSFVNNIVSTCGGYIWNGGGKSVYFSRNAYHSVTSGVAPAGTGIFGTANISLSGIPFTNAASDDFSLDNTSGEGAACRGISLGFLGSATTGYPDAGAVQHQDSGGGAAGMLYIPSLDGI